MAMDLLCTVALWVKVKLRVGEEVGVPSMVQVGEGDRELVGVAETETVDKVLEQLRERLPDEEPVAAAVGETVGVLEVELVGVGLRDCVCVKLETLGEADADIVPVRESVGAGGRLGDRQQSEVSHPGGGSFHIESSHR